MFIADILDRRLKDNNIPIKGVSIGNMNDKQTWVVNFLPEATAQDEIDAQVIIDTFDPVTEQQKIDDNISLAENTIINAKQFYIDNPNAKLLFELSQVDLEAEIDSLDLTTPSGIAKLKLLLKALATNDRVFARKQGLL